MTTLSRIIATKEEQQRRLGICKECPHANSENLFNFPVTRCDKCKCIMEFKVKPADMNCPVGKW